MTAIIVDDEAQSHEVLKRLLAEHHPDIRVLASGHNVAEGLELLRRHRPDLLFLDIEMPDGLGFDLLKKVGDPNFQIVFITAFEHYALRAIKFGALEYLLKPVSEEELHVALQKARQKKNEKTILQQLDIVWETLQNLPARKLPKRLSISTSEGILFKAVEDIIRLEAQQNYTEFTLLGEKKKILASLNLGEFEDQFEPYREFMRVHRSHLVNLTFVERFVKGDNYLVMADGAEISVSRSYRDGLLDRLDGL